MFESVDKFVEEESKLIREWLDYVIDTRVRDVKRRFSSIPNSKIWRVHTSVPFTAWKEMKENLLIMTRGHEQLMRSYVTGFPVTEEDYILKRLLKGEPFKNSVITGVMRCLGKNETVSTDCLKISLPNGEITSMYPTSAMIKGIMRGEFQFLTPKEEKEEYEAWKKITQGTIRPKNKSWRF